MPLVYLKYVLIRDRSCHCCKKKLELVDRHQIELIKGQMKKIVQYQLDNLKMEMMVRRQ